MPGPVKRASVTAPLSAMLESPLNSPPPPAPVGPAPDGVRNYFTAPAAAARYAAGRPSRHSRVLEIVAESLREFLPFAQALDVGCGTGHSTAALLPYATRVVGLDSSSAMLAQVQPNPRIEYRKGYAEALPFPGGHFDLATVSTAYHWFEHDRFLREAARVLRPDGWLVLYKAGSIGRPEQHPDFEFWLRQVLRVHYPKVARNGEALTAAKAAEFGLTEAWCETTAHRQTHTLESYVDNLMTHSSVIRVVDGGQESAARARAWLRHELERFFPSGETEFTHEVRIHALRRRRDAGAAPA